MIQILNLWQVDAFTKEPFKGNPAAVIVLYEEICDELMQNIAIENNLSETAFILKRDGKNPLLRWFTPMFEIDLCGHATLASAHIYLTEIYPELNEVTFDTKWVGALQVKKNNNRYTMNFPSRPGEVVEIQDIPSFVIDALSSVKPVEVYKSRDLMLVYDDTQTIYDINPDYNALMNYEDFIIVTAKSNNLKYDFISRFFCADDGIAEDPVTGSAHCTSTPYWSEKLDKKILKAYQASRRGGELDLEVIGDRIFITGEAVTILEGKMRV